MRRRLPALAALLALAVLPGCGLDGEPTARPLDLDTPVLETATATPQPTGASRERLYLVRDGELVPVSRATQVLSPRSALQDLIAGPTDAELARGLTSVVPATAQITLVGVEGGTAVVDLQGEVNRSDQVLALAQIVATLDASPGVDRVRFTSDGEVLPVPASDGALTEEPVTLADYRALLAR